MIDDIHKKNLKSLINSFNYKFFENISISRKKAFDKFFLKFYKKKIINNILIYSSKNMWSIIKIKEEISDNHTEGFIIISTKKNFFGNL